MLARIRTSALKGVTRYDVDVEVDTSPGLPAFDIVGLPDASLRESRERVRSAINNSGLKFPLKRVTVSLSPADTRKGGTGFDLAIALGILSSCGLVPDSDALRYSALGELSLDGTVRCVPGALPMVCNETRKPLPFLVPRDGMDELSLLEGYNLVPVSTLSEAVGFLTNGFPNETAYHRVAHPDPTGGGVDVDLADITGMEAAKRVLEIAASGGHHLLVAGPPGIGKSMIARALPGLLPPLGTEEAVEVAGIHSCAGLRYTNPGVRPFRAPHHSASITAMLGGGTHGTPGEVALAHNGVLILDELPEFRRDCLEALRQPMENGSITVARSRHSLTYPCGFQMVATTNLCPCGNHGLPDGRCRCGEPARRRYVGRISGPILDRFDLMIITQAQGLPRTSGVVEPSSKVRERVTLVRQFQTGRRGVLNSALPYRRLVDTEIDAGALALLDRATASMTLSHRAQVRVLRVARTIADMGGEPLVTEAHIAEALHYGTDSARL